MCVSPAAPPQLTSCKGCFLGPLDMLLFNNAGVQTGGHISGFWRSCVKCKEAVVPPGVVFFKTAFQEEKPILNVRMLLRHCFTNWHNLSASLHPTLPNVHPPSPHHAYADFCLKSRETSSFSWPRRCEIGLGHCPHTAWHQSCPREPLHTCHSLLHSLRACSHSSTSPLHAQAQSQ